MLNTVIASGKCRRINQFNSSHSRLKTEEFMHCISSGLCICLLQDFGSPTDKFYFKGGKKQTEIAFFLNKDNPKRNSILLLLFSF
jgi:hypothetical protein